MNVDMDITKELNELSESELTELQTRLKITPDMRIHTSKKPISKLEQKNYVQNPGKKPDGFWYGFGDEWIDWTETAGPERKGEYIYKLDISEQLKLSNDSKILQIKDYPEILEFTQEYGSSIQIIPGIIFSVDWPRIGLKYDGIEINPYIDQARIDDKTIWYYTWDVASGCIWNLDKVKIELIDLLKDEEAFGRLL